MSWGERSCNRIMCTKELCTMQNCNVDCVGYRHDGLRKPDSSTARKKMTMQKLYAQMDSAVLTGIPDISYFRTMAGCKPNPVRNIEAAKTYAAIKCGVRKAAAK